MRGPPPATRCPNCGAPLSATAKFCSECAHPTDRRAPSASASWRFVAPDIYTPKHLAEKILTSKDAFEGERKQVTVLFSRRDAFIERRAGREWELRARQPEVAAALERAREAGDADNAALLIGQDAGLIHDIRRP